MEYMSELHIFHISLSDNKITFENEKKSFNDIKNEINNFNMREMYLVDKKYCFDISSFIVKNNCILIKLDFIRCIIFKNKSYLLDVRNSDVNEIVSKLSKLKNYDNKKLFHIHIIDFFFTEICDYFYQIIHNITPEISINNERIKNGNYNYSHFIFLQSKLINLEYRVKELKNITQELTENKEDIPEILLDNKNIKDNKYCIESIEEMIENYFLKFQDLENDINRLTREMDNTQKIVNMNLLKQRNFYAIFQSYISMITLSLSFGSFIASIFGMNLNNSLEENDYAFFMILSLICFFILLICTIQICIFKNIDRNNIMNNM